MRRGVWADPKAGRVTLAKWSSEWQTTIVHLADSSKRIHADNIRLHVLPDERDSEGTITSHALGDVELGKITTAKLKTWLAVMMRKPRTKRSPATLAPASVHQAYRTLHLALEAAVSSGLVGRNPLVGVTAPRVEAKPIRFLEAHEVKALAATVPAEYSALVLIGCLCGLRAGELMALRWESVDMLGRKLHVIEQFDKERGRGAVKPPKTAAGRRVVPMPKAVVDALARHGAAPVEHANASERVALHVVNDAQVPRRSTASGLVFRAPTDDMIDLDQFRRTVWAKALKESGLQPLRIHDMRHTAASLAIKAGADGKVLHRMLGHASAAMTLDRYGHLMPGQAEAVADRLDILMTAAGSRLAVEKAARGQNAG